MYLIQNRSAINESLLSRLIFLIGMMALMLTITGCASTGSVDNDPLEKLNRGTTTFNLKADEYILAPTARGYRDAVPSAIRNGVHNFFTNLATPWTVINDLLQGNLRNAGRDTGRFLINTTLGLAGLNDVASYMDLPARTEDFGQTLAVWGVPSGPHLVLPFFGPSNIRDTVGLLPGMVYGSYTTPNNSPEDIAASVLNIVDARVQFLGTEEVLELQPDKYLFLREGYRQRRAAAIANGVPSGDEDSEDDLLDELLEEE